MPSALFWTFAVLMLGSALLVVCLRNPVSSALAMVGSFACIAALFIGLDAFFVGIIQILVYAGAIMVLFLFIIMLLDLKSDRAQPARLLPALAGVGLAVVLMVQLAGVLGTTGAAPFAPLDFAQAAATVPEGAIRESLAPAAGTGRQARLPDVHLVGRKLFTEYNLQLQIVGVLLLVATVGVVVLSRKQEPGPDRPGAGSQ